MKSPFSEFLLKLIYPPFANAYRSVRTDTCCSCIGPVFELNEEKHRLRVDGEGGQDIVKKGLDYSIAELRTEFQQVEVVAALQVSP